MIGAYMIDLITIWKWNGYDSWNEPLSGTAIETKGYVTWKTRLVRDIRGELVPSTVTVLLQKKIDDLIGRSLCHEDMIEIGGISNPRSIIAIGQPKAFSGPFYEVNLA